MSNIPANSNSDQPARDDKVDDTENRQSNNGGLIAAWIFVAVSLVLWLTWVPAAGFGANTEFTMALIDSGVSSRTAYLIDPSAYWPRYLFIVSIVVLIATLISRSNAND